MRMAIADAEYWMARCLTLAAHSQSRASPNPRVGAVLVDAKGQLLGEGWHRSFGDVHAEVAAVEDALSRHPAEKLKQATLYVNLEPCHHFGKTPPCTGMIMRYGISRVVVGMSDPNPRASGGTQHLQAQGVEVISGVLGHQCWRFNEAFAHHITTGRPLITLKIAQTLDGCVATRTGDSQWITGEKARRRVHQWRAESDAVLIGSGTASVDNPSLTVRHIEGPQPERIVIDSRGRLPANLKLFTDQWTNRTTAVVSKACDPAYANSLTANGGRIVRLAANDEGYLDLEAIVRTLGTQTNRPPVQSLFVEAGPGLATALLEADLVDRLFVFFAPRIIGQGIGSIGDLGVVNLADAYDFAEHAWEILEPDILFRGYKHKAKG